MNAVLTLDQVLHEAKRLPLDDRRALADLIDVPKSIEEMAAEQGIKPFNFAEARAAAADIWPEEESIDDFNTWLRESRREGAAESRLD